MISKRCLFYFLVLFSFSSSSLAFRVSPIELNFSTKGKQSVQTISLENTTDSKIPVEIFAYDRIHKNGKETRVLTRDFYYFPKQFILKPGEKRNIRVSWMGIRDKTPPKDKKKMMKKGKTSLVQEKAYRLSLRQVPVDLKRLKSKKTGISFLYNYVASLYVTPPRAKPDLKVLSHKRLKANKVEFEIKNAGGAHAILSSYNLHALGKNSMVIDIKKQKDEVQGVNLLAGERRKVIMEVPKTLGKGQVSFEIKKRK